MQTFDLKDVIKALTFIALLALGAGKLNELHSFAKIQAAKSLSGWPEQKPFFPDNYSAVKK